MVCDSEIDGPMFFSLTDVKKISSRDKQGSRYLYSSVFPFLTFFWLVPIIVPVTKIGGKLLFFNLTSIVIGPMHSTKKSQILIYHFRMSSMTS